jgi:hypothetical protein
MNDEEVAFRIVRLYFEDVARLGFKRQLDLDQMINSYFYTLKKLKGKDAALKKATEQIVREEKEIVKKEVPGVEKQEQKTVTTVTTTVSSEKPKEKTIAEILEEK